MPEEFRSRANHLLLDRSAATLATMATAYVEAEDIRRSPFRVSLAPLASLTIALHDTGLTGGWTPAAWRDEISRHLRGADHETLAPVLACRPAQLPELLLGLADPPGESLKDGVARLLATPEPVLARAFAGCAAASGSAAWVHAAGAPRRWLRRYVATLLRAWNGFGPVWRNARPTLDREVERVGMATALDAQLEFLDGLLDDGGVADGRWWVRSEAHRGRVRLPGDGLVLAPLVAGERSSIVAGSGDVLRRLAYPVRPVLALAPAERAATLEALVGGPRSQILRATVSPTSIGLLAKLLRAVPSAATHHVGALEEAGLVERARQGRHVLVRRTARGRTLVELYNSRPATG
jgi:DNA-binding transcriptional ArsR family regulator